MDGLVRGVRGRWFIIFDVFHEGIKDWFINLVRLRGWSLCVF